MLDRWDELAFLTMHVRGERMTHAAKLARFRPGLSREFATAAASRA